MHKKRFLLLTIIFFVVLTVVAVFLYKRSAEKPLDAQQIKKLPDPDLVAEKFLHALIDDNISLAKELVIQEKRTRLDQWEMDTQHRAFECPYNWRWILSEPIQMISVGGARSIPIDDKTVNAHGSFVCNNNNQSMRIKNVIIKNSDGEWTIIDWGEICETPASYDEKERCYP